MTFTFGSLFAGIGGIDLGLERAGMECRWQVEIDDYATKVLEKHWPDVARFRDVRDCGMHNLEPVDLIAGGFPCQDISHAGKREGIKGERSGLWSEFYRIICELRPRYVLVENVSALLVRGMGVVLGDLAACGYDAEWESLPAAAFGTPHIRDRVFILAYAESGTAPTGQERTGRNVLNRCCEDVPNTTGKQRRESQAWNGRQVFTGRVEEVGSSEFWASEPDVCRVVDGFPGRVDRCATLGNAVVPQVAEWIGRRIVSVI